MIVYSSLNASIGLTLVALNAGINPIKVLKSLNFIILQIQKNRVATFESERDSHF